MSSFSTRPNSGGGLVAIGLIGKATQWEVKRTAEVGLGNNFMLLSL